MPRSASSPVGRRAGGKGRGSRLRTSRSEESPPADVAPPVAPTGGKADAVPGTATAVATSVEAPDPARWVAAPKGAPGTSAASAPQRRVAAQAVAPVAAAAAPDPARWAAPPPPRVPAPSDAANGQDVGIVQGDDGGGGGGGHAGSAGASGHDVSPLNGRDSMPSLRIVNSVADSGGGVAGQGEAADDSSEAAPAELASAAMVVAAAADLMLPADANGFVEAAATPLASPPPPDSPTGAAATATTPSVETLISALRARLAAAAARADGGDGSTAADVTAGAALLASLAALVAPPSPRSGSRDGSPHPAPPPAGTVAAGLDPTALLLAVGGVYAVVDTAAAVGASSAAATADALAILLSAGRASHRVWDDAEAVLTVVLLGLRRHGEVCDRVVVAGVALLRCAVAAAAAATSAAAGTGEPPSGLPLPCLTHRERAEAVAAVGRAVLDALGGRWAAAVAADGLAVLTALYEHALCVEVAGNAPALTTITGGLALDVAARRIAAAAASLVAALGGEAKWAGVPTADLAPFAARKASNKEEEATGEPPAATAAAAGAASAAAKGAKADVSTGKTPRRRVRGLSRRRPGKAAALTGGPPAAAGGRPGRRTVTLPASASAPAMAPRDSGTPTAAGAITPSKTTPWPRSPRATGDAAEAGNGGRPRRCSSAGSPQVPSMASGKRSPPAGAAADYALADKTLGTLSASSPQPASAPIIVPPLDPAMMNLLSRTLRLLTAIIRHGDGLADAATALPTAASPVSAVATATAVPGVAAGVAALAVAATCLACRQSPVWGNDTASWDIGAEDGDTPPLGAPHPAPPPALGRSSSWGAGVATDGLAATMAAEAAGGGGGAGGVPPLSSAARTALRRTLLTDALDALDAMATTAGGQAAVAVAGGVVVLLDGLAEATAIPGRQRSPAT